MTSSLSIRAPSLLSSNLTQWRCPFPVLCRSSPHSCDIPLHPSPPWCFYPLLWSHSLLSSAFIQPNRFFVLQTQPSEPALDLYFSVCVWPPRPMDGWKLMSSPSPGIQSEQGNYAAIWSSSALQSHQIVPPSAAPACLTQLLSSNVMTTKTSCTDCLHCPASARPLQSGSEWQAHEFLQQCHLT